MLPATPSPPLDLHPGWSLCSVADQWAWVSSCPAASGCLLAVPVWPAVAVPGSSFTGTCPARPGLTVPREAFWLSAPLAASVSRFAAALTSRSRVRPQLAQVYMRSDRASLVFTAPLAMIGGPPRQVFL